MDTRNNKTKRCIVNETKKITIELFPNKRQLVQRNALNIEYERKVLNLSKKKPILNKTKISMFINTMLFNIIN